MLNVKVNSFPYLKYNNMKKKVCSKVEERFRQRLSGKESTCNAGDAGSISGSERSPGGGNSNPLQYFC